MIWHPARFRDLMSVKLEDHSPDIRDQLSDSDEMSVILRACARAMWDGGRVIGVVGVWPMHKGVGLAWTLLSAEAKQHPFTLHRGTLGFLRYIEERDGYWRIQSTVDPRYPENRAWLIRLGFIYEGKMRCYGMDREDHDLYARVRR